MVLISAVFFSVKMVLMAGTDHVAAWAERATRTVYLYWTKRIAPNIDTRGEFFDQFPVAAIHL
jgi:hypothetical protein